MRKNVNSDLNVDSPICSAVLSFSRFDCTETLLSSLLILPFYISVENSGSFFKNFHEKPSAERETGSWTAEPNQRFRSLKCYFGGKKYEAVIG